MKKASENQERAEGPEHILYVKGDGAYDVVDDLKTHPKEGHQHLRLYKLRYSKQEVNDTLARVTF